MFILGISAFYHDSAAAILNNSKIIGAAHEERFTRIKHDQSFPTEAIKYVLNEADVTLKEIDLVIFYDKPLLKFERLLETYHAFAPKGISSFLSAVPVWIKEKLFLRKNIRNELIKLGALRSIPLKFSEHHLSHASSAFYPSPYQDAAILTIDGVGEWATTTISKGSGNSIKVIKQLDFPHSIGLLYSAFTYYCGFKVNSGEYKLMGLAPYGIADDAQTKDFKKKIKENLIHIKEDGSLILNMEYFNFATGLRMCNDKKWKKLFQLSPRSSESEVSQPYMNMALAIQQVTEEIILKLARTAKDVTNCTNLCLAGGVALNSVANGKILKTGMFENIWIQPAAGDAGGALGAAYAGYFIYLGRERKSSGKEDEMQGAFLGPEFNDKDIKKVVNKYNASSLFFDDFNALSQKTAQLLAEGYVVGWFQGRMEYGPRALGNRSILGDARSPEMQKKMNLKIKYREGFRPFAPSVLEEVSSVYFEINEPSPYMLMVIPVNENIKKNIPIHYMKMELYERLYYTRSELPAVTHVDFSARIQTVNQDINPRYWSLINDFRKLTGYGVIVNTSFNVRGEPIVCTPDDAFRCFMRTEMDYLVLNNFLFKKNEQNQLENDSNWKEEFELD